MSRRRKGKVIKVVLHCLHNKIFLLEGKKISHPSASASRFLIVCVYCMHLAKATARTWVQQFFSASAKMHFAMIIFLETALLTCIIIWFFYCEVEILSHWLSDFFSYFQLFFHKKYIYFTAAFYSYQALGLVELVCVVCRRAPCQATRPFSTFNSARSEWTSRSFGGREENIKQAFS